MSSHIPVESQACRFCGSCTVRPNGEATIVIGPSPAFYEGSLGSRGRRTFAGSSMHEDSVDRT